MYWVVSADWWVGTAVSIGKCWPTGGLVLLYLLEGVGRLVGWYYCMYWKVSADWWVGILYVLESIGRLVGWYYCMYWKVSADW